MMTTCDKCFGMIALLMTFILVTLIGSDDPYAPNSIHASSDILPGQVTSNVNKHNLTDDIAQSSTEDTIDTPVIIWWTPRLFYPHSLKCGEAHCISTANRNCINHSKFRKLIFYFYGSDLDPEDMPLPRKHEHQWALFHEESPMNNYMLVHGTMISLFNHTATFRRESDFPLVTQHIPSKKYLMRPPYPVIEKNRQQVESGIAALLYVQSHCDVSSDRDRYILELSQYISIDSVGKCMNNKKMSPKMNNPVESMHSAEFLDYISRYKFHLAFENAICNDYMTEKLFRSLHVGSVPVYRGSPIANHWMPDEKAFIDVNDFPSPKDLAAYLEYLNGNDSAYEEYLMFKKPNGITNLKLLDALNTRKWGNNVPGQPDMLHGFECHLCRKAHEQLALERKLGRAHDLKPSIAGINHLHCPQPYTSVGDPDDYPNTDRWKQHNWIDDYWSGFDRARALRNMIMANETDSTKFSSYLMDILDYQR